MKKVDEFVSMLLVIIIFAIIVTPTHVYARTAIILGSRYQVDYYEILTAQSVANDIAGNFSGRGFPRGNLASGFPGSVRVFIASLPGLSGLHITQKPLIRVVDSNLRPKTHHPRVNTRGEVNKFKPTIHSYLQLTASNYRSVTGFTQVT